MGKTMTDLVSIGKVEDLAKWGHVYLTQSVKHQRDVVLCMKYPDRGDPYGSRRKAFVSLITGNYYDYTSFWKDDVLEHWQSMSDFAPDFEWASKEVVE